MRTRRSPEQAERIRRIVSMKRAKFTEDHIGRVLGISQQRVSQLYRRALTEIPARELHEHRVEELDFIDAAIRGLLPIAHDRAHPRTAVEAWNAIRGWTERKAKLLGLDAPSRSRVEVVTQDMVDEQIALLEAELGAYDGAVPGSR